MLSRRTTKGGSTSTYPCSRVCRSSMKLISPRTSFDPAPTNTGKPDPEIFAPRARSSRPSVSPSSQCGLPPRGAGSPQGRATLLCDSSPSGASASGRLGTYSSLSSTAASMPRSSASRVSMRCPSARRPSRTAAGSPPFFFLGGARPPPPHGRRRLARFLHEAAVALRGLVALPFELIELTGEGPAAHVERLELVEQPGEARIAAPGERSAPLLRRGRRALV